MKNNVTQRHVRTLSHYNLKASLETGGCGKCQAACQSACKTSCTVGNIACENK
ncbi:MAG: six-cysteine peptide SCIFF [Firmicutes bacterium]|nr:six-cysteine peptide SCIFF [Bacillota bacterium]